MHVSAKSNSTAGLQRLWYAALLLALVGLGFAVELTRIHLRLQNEPSHQSICNISASVNCDAVAASSYSMLLGLPLSIWGIFGYSAAIGASVWGLRTQSRAAAAVAWLLSVVCIVSALGLAGISALVLKVWCLFCLCTWVVDLGLFVVATRLVRVDGLASALLDLWDWFRDNVKLALALAAMGGLGLGIAYRAYGHPRDALSQTASAAGMSRGVPSSSGKPLEGVDETGNHYVGAQKPKLVITAFSDYQCPHCAMANQQLRALVAAYPNAIRVVHRHFPLDNDCNPKIGHVFHTHACYYARLAICAASLGKFSQGNDYLFAHGRDESSVAIEAFARAIEMPAAALKECLSTQADAVLKRDVELGLSRGLDGTPTFLIAGEKHEGELPAEVLRDYPL